MIGAIGRWLDYQLGLARFVQKNLRKVFPDHWSFILGEVALYSFVVLVITGTYLAFFFHPSGQPTAYVGSYGPLQQVEMSQAYASVLNISFDVRGGLFVRQVHHWAALLFVAAIALHMTRVFFTGAYRRPRQLNWLIGVTLLFVAIFSGFTGYSVVDDLLSGTGLVIGYSVLLSIPFMGAWLAFLLFGGPVPNPSLVPRLYSIHIMILPGLIAVLLALHLAILWRQKHTNYPGPQRSNKTIVGTRLWPVYATKAFGLFFVIFGILAILGAFVQINPVWLYGPYDPSSVTVGSQPDWYLGWLEGALRLSPAWEMRIFGHLVPNPFFAGGLLALLMLAGLYVWPFLDAWITGDHEIHHVLDRPRDRPVRTAVGVFSITFFVVLLVAGSDDVLAVLFDASIETLRVVLAALAIILPIVAGVAAYFISRRLSARSPLPGSPPSGDPVG
ncbi:MAG: cytochrome bc complex cytochrome b subunit [Acidimicrobiia bacterium]